MEPSRPASSDRFRRAGVVPSSPQHQLEALLEDGPRLSDAFERLLQSAASRDDHEEIALLVTAAQGASDPQRAYVALHHGATRLHELSAARRASRAGEWVAPLDAALRLLVASLARDPHEPELLALTGGVLFQLGDRARAERLLAVAARLDPEHRQASVHLAHVRSQAGRPALDATAQAPAWLELREDLDAIVERAADLPDRTISLCMIVRDEEEMLPACLEAAAPFVDEIVIVDTGSQDRTREIAREHGAQVHELPWTGDFSAARNEGLRHATSDWILWLDADEQLVVEDGERLRELARCTWVEGWSVLETHLLGDGEDGSGTAMHAPMRLFRRRPEHRWSGTVHEQVAASLPGWVPGRVRASTVRVNHYGYMADLVVDRDKRARNLELLLRQHEESPSAFTSFNIGTEHAAGGDWSDANAWFERSLGQLHDEGTPWRSQRWTSLLVQRATTARRMTGDYAGALALAREGLATWPEYADLAFEQAHVHLDARDWSAAEAAARRALALGDAPAELVAVRGKGSFQARLLLAAALRGSGDLEAARDELVHVLTQEEPGFLPAASDLVDVLVALDADDDSLEQAIDEALGERAASVPANLAVGTRLHDAGRIAPAQRRYERILDASPSEARALLALSEIALGEGRVQDAWQLAMRVEPSDRLAAKAAQTAFLAAAASSRTDLLDEPARRIAEAGDALHAAERAVYVAWHRLLVPDEHVHVLVPQDDAARTAVLRNLEALARLEATEAFERLHPLLETVFDDEYQRRLHLARLYVRLRFPDLAGEEFMLLAQRFGPDAAILTGLGKVATMKDMWEDAHVFLSESLLLDPAQPDAERLLAAVAERCGA